MTAPGTLPAASDAAYSNAVLASQPLAYWPLQDAAGSTQAVDIAGTYPLTAGTLGGGRLPIFGVAGPLPGGTAVSWNYLSPNSGYLQAQPTPPVNTNGFTIEMWALCSNAAIAQMLAVINVPANAFGSNTIMMQMSGGYGGPYASGPGSVFTSWNQAGVTDAQWHHWALTYNLGGWAIYRDGVVFVASQANPYVGAGFTPTVVSFGSRYTGATPTWNQNSDGAVAHIALYNRPLAQAEIQNHYDGIFGAPPGGSQAAYIDLVTAAGPQLYYPLADPVGAIRAIELIGVTKGLVEGGVTFGVTDPWGNPAAAQFDGSTGYIVDALQRAGQPQVFSLECWYQTTQVNNTFIEFNIGQTALTGTFTPDLYTNGASLTGRVYTSAPYEYSDPVVTNDGQWHHGVFTVDDNTNLCVYRDGVLVASGPGLALQQVFGGYWRIGSGGAGFAAGGIAHVAVYNRVLTSAEVAAHAAAVGQRSYNLVYNPANRIYKWQVAFDNFLPVATTTLSVSPHVHEFASVPLQATAGMVLAATVHQLGNVTLAGGAALNLSALVTHHGTVADAAHTTLTIGGSVHEFASVALHATSSFVAAGIPSAWGTVVLHGTTGWNVHGLVTEIAAVHLSGSTSLLVVGAPTVLASTALTSTASLVLAARVTEVASMSMQGWAAMHLAGFVVGQEEADLAATSDLIIAARLTVLASVDLAPTSSLTVEGFVLHGGVGAILDAYSGLTIDGALDLFGSTDLAATSGLTVDTYVYGEEVVDLVGASDLTVVGFVFGSEQVDLVARSELTVAGTIAGSEEVDLVGVSELTVVGFVFGSEEVDLVATSELTAVGYSTAVEEVDLVADSGLTVAGSVLGAEEVDLVATSGLTVVSFVFGADEVYLVGTTDLAVEGYSTAVEEVDLVAVSDLTVVGSVTGSEEVDLVATSDLTVDGWSTAVEEVDLVATSDLTAVGFAIAAGIGTILNAHAGLTVDALQIVITDPMVLTGTGSLTVTLTDLGEVDLSAQSSLDVRAENNITSPVSMKATTSMSVGAMNEALAQVDMAARSRLYVTAAVAPSQQVLMAATASMMVVAVVTHYGQAEEPTLEEQLKAIAGLDPILMGATGYLDPIFTSRLAGDSE
jgi:Concanavalin A-like lectin/glucanases superfamily